MTLGAPYGIPVRLHPSFAAMMVAFAAWGLMQGGVRGAIVAAGLVVGMAVSVVLHELGHALAARRFGIRTAHVTLYPWGGAAALEEMPRDPDQEVVVALAGPAANLAVAAVLGLLWLVWSNPLVQVLALTNGALALMNLVPAYPLDGGRALRAVLSRRMGFVAASHRAMRLGHGFAAVSVVMGTLLAANGAVAVGLTLALTGVFLIVALRHEREHLVAAHWQDTTGAPPPWMASSSERRHAPPRPSPPDAR